MKILGHYADSTYTNQRKELNEFGPLGYYRVVAPLGQVKNHDVTIVGQEIQDYGDDLSTRWDNIFASTDVFWTGYFSGDRVGAAVFYYAHEVHKKKVIVDIDDNYLDIPESNGLYDKFKRTKRDRAILSTILSFADAITVSTYPLKEKIFEHIKYVHGIEKPIFVVPNMNDYKFWEAPKAPLNPDRVTIGYAGSNSHQDDLLMVLPAIANLMKKHKNLYLQIAGSIEEKKIKTYFKSFRLKDLDRVEVGGGESIFKKYPTYLGSQSWDIGIAPLVDTAFTRSKSHIKWMEYSMFNIPTVASRVYPYFMPINGRKTIEHEKTGMLCRPQEWEETLERMILDENLRKQIGENANKFVKDNWQYSQGNISETVDKMLSVI